MRRLLIVGAGRFAREVFSWAKDAEGSADWRVGGFLSDLPDDLDGYEYPVGIAGRIDDFAPAANDVLAMGISEPRDKLALAERLEARGARFVNVVHPSVILARNVEIGRGCVLCPRVTVSCDAEIGSFVSINIGSAIGHDARLGDGCTISSLCDVMGAAALAKAVFLGGHSSVLPGVVVGESAIVGAGSVAMRNVKAGTTVLGVPAKLLDL